MVGAAARTEVWFSRTLKSLVLRAQPLLQRVAWQTPLAKQQMSLTWLIRNLLCVTLSDLGSHSGCRVTDPAACIAAIRLTTRHLVKPLAQQASSHSQGFLYRPGQQGWHPTRQCHQIEQSAQRCRVYILTLLSKQSTISK